MKIINYETKLHVTFAVLDDEGDVAQKVPLVFELPKHNEKVFAEAFKAVLSAKDHIEKQMLEKTPVEPTENK